MSDNNNDASIPELNSPSSEEPLQVSLFRLLQKEYGPNLPLACLTKASLVELSHFLEATVLKNRLPAMVFTGFQQSKYWQEEIQRYRELAELTHSLCVFSGPVTQAQNEKDGQEIDMVVVRLTPDDALRQEWFLIVLTKDFSVLLCGLDRLEPTEREADRLFDTIITFEPAVITRSLDLLEEVLARYRPDRLAQVREGRQLFPVVSPTPAYLTLFIGQFLEQSSRYRLKAKQLDQEQAMRATIARLLHDASQPLTTLSSLLELSQRLGEISLEEVDILAEASNELIVILERLREVNKFHTSKYDNTYYLDTGKPLV